MAAVTTRSDDSTPSLEAAADEVVASGVPGVIVRLRDGDDVQELAKGEASVGDRFRIGSVTKTFVAALALNAAELGTLSLEDTAAELEPGIVSDAKEITVRELLSHRAGLFDYTSDPALLRGELDPRALIAIADGKPRTEGYAYSSTNYLVLGLLLQRAGLAGLAEQLERQILEPYGLDQTTFESDTVPGSYLHGHERSTRDGIATGTLRDTDDRTARSAWAAGAMVSTAADLDSFFTQLLASDARPADAAEGRRALRPRACALRHSVRPGGRPHRQPARRDHRRLDARGPRARHRRERVPADARAGDCAAVAARARFLRLGGLGRRSRRAVCLPVRAGGIVGAVRLLFRV